MKNMNLKTQASKCLAASLLGLVVLGSAGVAHAETPPAEPIGAFEMELLPVLPPLPMPPLPMPPLPVPPLPVPPLPIPPLPFPPLPVSPFPFPGPFPAPGDFGVDVGSVTAELHVECSLAEFNVWVGIENTTDDPAVVTIDSPFMDPQLVAVAPHGDLVVPVDFDHIEHSTIAVTAEFDASLILDDEQSIACLAPDVSYSLHYDCDSETAAISLVNEGLLPAQMGYVVAPAGPTMHTVNPGGNKEVALPHGEGEYLEMDVIADGETMFHGVWGFDCPEPPVAEVPEAVPADVPETPATPEATATPDSGKLADDSELVPVDLTYGEGDETQDDGTEDDQSAEESTESDNDQSGVDEEDIPEGGSRSAAPALILVSLLGAGGIAGATAWGRR